MLDVACGTGILIPYYLERNVKKITGIDISSEMINIARLKFANDKTEFFNADIEEIQLKEKYDCCIVYNAFPHFPEPESLIKHLSGVLTAGGCLTVAHGLSRQRINAHHIAKASHVSEELMSEKELAELFASYLDVTAIISDDEKYIVSGKKR